MKKLLLIGLVAGGLSFAAVPRSDAQVYFSIGFGPGYLRILPLRVLLSVPLLPAVLWLLPALLLVRRAPLLPSPPSPSLLSVLSERRIQKALTEPARKQFRASTFLGTNVARRMRSRKKPALLF